MKIEECKTKREVCVIIYANSLCNNKCKECILRDKQVDNEINQYISELIKLILRYKIGIPFVKGKECSKCHETIKIIKANYDKKIDKFVVYVCYNCGFWWYD